MRRVSVVQAAVGLVVLFVLSVGVGYGVGAQARQAADAAPAPAETASAPTVSTTTAVDASTEAPPTSSVPPSTTTTSPPTVPPTTARPQPLRIVLAGDSVMAGLAPPVEAALEANGQADVRFVLTPTILRDPTVRFSWSRQLAEFDPDLVVMFVGTWESGVVEGTAPGVVPADTSWRAEYERTILDPWVQLITSEGADVLWVTNPIVRNDDANRVFATLNAAFADLPSRWRQVHLVDAGPALNGPGPAYHDTLRLPDGTVVRTRQVDGLHLCPDGAALLARVVSVDIADRYGLDEPRGWERGSWRTNDAVYPVASCPSP